MAFSTRTYWPQLLMRTTLMFAIAAAYAIAVATRVKDEAVKSFVTKAASKWGVAGTVLGVILSVLYVKTLPAGAHDLVGSLVTPGLKAGMVLAAGLLILYFLFAAMKPARVKLIPAIVAIIVVFVGIRSAERAREIVKKPFIIPQYMYSNQIIGKDIPAKGVRTEMVTINEKGILRVAPFVPEGLREVRNDNAMEAGRMVALIECSSCHAFGASGLRPMTQMVRQAGLKDVSSATAFVDSLGDYPYMPPFAGTLAEKKALATYLDSFNTRM